MHQQTRAYLFAGGAVLLWSTVASAFKISLRYLEPMQLVLFSSLFSAMVLFIVLIVQGKIHLLRRYPKKQLPFCFLLGMLNPFLYYFALFEAYDRLPAQEALSINYSWPVMLVLLSIILLKQRVRVLELVAIFVAYGGVVVVATQGNPLTLHFEDPAGIGFAFASTIIWAAFWVFNVKLTNDPIATLLLSFLFALPVLGFTTFIFAPVDQVTLISLTGAAYVGFFEMGLTFVLWLTALKSSETSAKVSGLAFVTPFLSLLVIYVVVGEQIKAATLLGLIFIVAGIILQTIFSRRAESTSAADSVQMG